MLSIVSFFFNNHLFNDFNIYPYLSFSGCLEISFMFLDEQTVKGTISLDGSFVFKTLSLQDFRNLEDGLSSIKSNFSPHVSEMIVETSSLEHYKVL